MKKYLILSLFIPTFALTRAQQTENISSVTVVFNPNEPQKALLTNGYQKNLTFYVFAPATFKETFKSNLMKKNGIIDCSYDKKSTNLMKLSLSPEYDFDALKQLLIENQVNYVGIEDTIIPITNWQPFTEEQIKQIEQLNANISNIEEKRNYVLQNPQYLEMSKENGWLLENERLLNEAKKAKKNYIRQILK
jgi:hypothetical protein